MLAGKPDSARAAYERYLNAPEDRLEQAPIIGSSLLAVAELHDAAGDTANALRRYNDLVNLWAKADPEVQPRVAAVKRRMMQLRGKG